MTSPFQNEYKLGSWIPLYQNFPYIKGNILFSPEEDEDKDGESKENKDSIMNILVILDVTIPPQYDSKLPEIKEVTGYRKLNLERIHEYFANILASHSRITLINQLSTEVVYDDLICHNCPNRKCTKYCTECVELVCNDCAFEHDINNHVLTQMKEFDKEYYVGVCDNCKILMYCRNGQWYSNETRDVDICPDCLHTRDGLSHVGSPEGKEDGRIVNIDTTNFPPFQTGFGSILDWVPILEDIRKDLVLYNMVPGSKSYHRVCIRASKLNGDYAYHVVPGDLVTFLSKINESLLIDYALQENLINLAS